MIFAIEMNFENILFQLENLNEKIYCIIYNFYMKYRMKQWIWDLKQVSDYQGRSEVMGMYSTVGFFWEVNYMFLN